MTSDETLRHVFGNIGDETEFERWDREDDEEHERQNAARSAIARPWYMATPEELKNLLRRVRAELESWTIRPKGSMWEPAEGETQFDCWERLEAETQRLEDEETMAMYEGFEMALEFALEGDRYGWSAYRRLRHEAGYPLKTKDIAKAPPEYIAWRSERVRQRADVVRLALMAYERHSSYSADATGVWLKGFLKRLGDENG